MWYTTGSYLGGSRCQPKRRQPLPNSPNCQCQTKAELVNGEVVMMSPTGFLPGRAGGEIYASLRAYERQHRTGYAIPKRYRQDGVTFNGNSIKTDCSGYILRELRTD
ncbi:MAG: hypothetical protein HC828_09500 [Blastochloris sp.]|nr:hypothetical protein [Blastochloris sp.]